VSVKFAERQRSVFQRQIEEGKYLKPAPRVEPILFKTIADTAVEYFKTFTRCWDVTEGRVTAVQGMVGRSRGREPQLGGDSGEAARGTRGARVVGLHV
jgi:hypothetical protein